MLTGIALRFLATCIKEMYCDTYVFVSTTYARYVPFTRADLPSPVKRRFDERQQHITTLTCVAPSAGMTDRLSIV
jgi:hypothetical protein